MRSNAKSGAEPKVGHFTAHTLDLLIGRLMGGEKGADREANAWKYLREQGFREPLWWVRAWAPTALMLPGVT